MSLLFYIYFPELKKKKKANKAYEREMETMGKETSITLGIMYDQELWRNHCNPTMKERLGIGERGN